jgi:hypothetical protein
MIDARPVPGLRAIRDRHELSAMAAEPPQHIAMARLRPGHTVAVGRFGARLIFRKYCEIKPSI